MDSYVMLHTERKFGRRRPTLSLAMFVRDWPTQQPNRKLPSSLYRHDTQRFLTKARESTPRKRTRQHSPRAIWNRNSRNWFVNVTLDSCMKKNMRNLYMVGLTVKPVMAMPPAMSRVSGMASLSKYGQVMLSSPQKKPRSYGVTAFNSHAKNGMEADERRKKKG